jgi:four helix bundle protein
MGKSILRDKSYQFAIDVVKVCRVLQLEQKEFVLSKQLLRSGTAIGALLREAEFGQSKADFINKINIALKEANESAYWLDLLKDTELLDESAFSQMKSNCDELIKMLVSSLKTLKNEK